MAVTAQTPKVIRVVADLIVDEDQWEEAVEQGASERFLVGEVRKTLRIEASGPYYNVEIQEVRILAKGGDHGQS